MKTVIIQGAGFSASVDAPIQSQLIRDIFALSSKDVDQELRQLFNDNRYKARQFLEHVLYLRPEDFNQISLEDIYTPLDKCLVDKKAFRHLSLMEVADIRKSFSCLIMILMKHRLTNIAANTSHVTTLAQKLLKANLKGEDPAIISTNWDIIMDNALRETLDRDPDTSVRRGVVDYCCYTNKYRDTDRVYPGLVAKTRGFPSLKLLKIHGSMNWLRCQRCQRLFVTFFEKISLNQFFSGDSNRCPICDENYRNTSGFDGGALLTSDLMMPTFAKDLSNVQLKLTWQNAGTELAEASRIIFMGYSFPGADFDLRQLLSRTVRHEVDIDVVLWKTDNPEEYPDPDLMRRYLPPYRYRSFFGSRRKVRFYYEGVKKYIEEELEF